MDLIEAVAARHSVRKYLPTPIEPEKVGILKNAADEITASGGIRAVLLTEEPEAFCAAKPHYGSFSGCRNYIAMIGKKHDDEKIGYFGEHLVLLAQTLGLNTCWVALTYEKGKVPVTLAPGEKIFDLIALGYGETQGTPHRSKSPEKVSDVSDASPEWYKNGVRFALLAPTAVNQQRFYFTLTDTDLVRVKALIGPCSKTDLGIVKYHFELGAGKENFKWKE